VVPCSTVLSRLCQIGARWRPSGLAARSRSESESGLMNARFVAAWVHTRATTFGSLGARGVIDPQSAFPRATWTLLSASTNSEPQAPGLLVGASLG
jgi:hypothetical protein